LVEKPSQLIHLLVNISKKVSVYPIYPEWFELFELGNIYQPKSAVSDRASKQFAKHKIPFRPYDLRHAWAIRSMEFGLPLELAAVQMGHSMTVHSRTYHRWISDRHHKRAFDIAKNAHQRNRTS
jgi:integrase